MSEDSALPLGELRRVVRRQLFEAKVPDAAQEADLLLRHVFSCTQAKLLAHPDRRPSKEEVETLRALLRRREHREPLQYVLASAEFFGRTFAVGPGVLVPRPETELLAELALDLLPEEPFVFLDWGTGSGCIGATLLLERPNSRGLFVEKNPLSLSFAWKNLKTYGLLERALLLHSRAPLDIPVRGECDLVVSNPPYIPTHLLEQLMPEVRDHEPRLALDGGLDGMDCYRLLFASAPRWLRHNGLLILELGDADQARILEANTPEKFVLQRKLLDFSAIPRCMAWRYEG